jgi:hypothetical protein
VWVCVCYVCVFCKSAHACMLLRCCCAATRDLACRAGLHPRVVEVSIALAKLFVSAMKLHTGRRSTVLSS